jgi:carboxymethylenebutenolidase
LRSDADHDPAYATLAVMNAEVTVEPVDIAAADGTADAIFVHPLSGAPHPGVLLYMDAYGIRPALEAHAARLARGGYCVLVPNLFYRHGRSPVLENLEQLMQSEDRSALFAQLRPKIEALTPEAANADAKAWLGFLRDRAEARDGPIGTVGYCMGGRFSLRMAGEFPAAVGAAASFHGAGMATDQPDSPHLAAVHATGELYIGHADNDRGMDPQQMGRLTEALAKAHVRHTAELYVGALHGWTQTDAQVYDEAATERHWSRLLELFGRVLQP